jgi:hypothetical protein
MGSMGGAEVLMRLSGPWIVVCLVLLIGGSASALPGLTARAAPAGQDACPEPNNDFQRACFVSANAQGVLQSPDDVDAFRFEALDHGTQVQVALLDPPGPYRLNLADWTGAVIASSSLQEGSEVIDARVGPPGSYYVFVDSKTGEVSPEPYRLLYQPTYAGPAPQLLFSREFGAGTEDNAYPPTAEADFQGGGGKVTIVMKVGGTPERPREANVTLGPAAGDFTLAVDSRLVNAETSVDAISAVGFRVTDDGSAYRLLIDVHKSAARLQFVRGGTVIDLSDWVVSGVIDTQGGVNRTVIRADGPSIRVNMNGQPLLEAAGPSAQAGRFQLGLITESEPPIVSFDNMLVTTPGR